MKLTLILSCLFLSLLLANEEYCITANYNSEGLESKNSRQYYNIGDSISDEDQQNPYNVCYSDGNYSQGSIFKLSDYSGEIMLISMNATW